MGFRISFTIPRIPGSLWLSDITMDGSVSENESFNGIQLGKRYHLEMAPSEESVLTLQYRFKPANIDHTQSGKLLLQQNDESTVELRKEDGSVETFQGTAGGSSISGQDRECLLIFENGGFRIHKINTSVLNLNPVRAETKFVGLNTAKSTAEQKNIAKLLKNSLPKKVKSKKKVEPVVQQSDIVENVTASLIEKSIPVDGDAK